MTEAEREEALAEASWIFSLWEAELDSSHGLDADRVLAGVL